jgi:LPXTG-site transpeptidase (sortase) family protein
MRFLQRAAAILCVTSLTVSAQAASFADVTGTGYETAFEYLSGKGIVEQGRPYAPLNRAEALKVVIGLQNETKQRAEWYKTNMPKVGLFPDVPLNAWFAPYVETGHEKKIVKGYPNGSFHPERLLSVEEAVTLLMRSVGEDAATGGAQQSAAIENRDGQWYTAPVNAAIAKNLIPARERLKLGYAITRGQFFSMVHRLHVVRTTGIARFDDGSDTVQPPAPILVSSPQQAPSAGHTVRPLTQLPVINAPQPIGVSRPVTVATGNTAQGHEYGSEKYFSVTIPKAGITDLTITHPMDPFSKDGVLAPLQSGVGHLFSYPGNGGKIMIYGHSSSFPWDVSPYTKIFRQINSLTAGDRIYVTYSGTLYTYEVTFEEAIPASDTTRFQDNGSGEELILYTCWPPDDISQRYLIHAIPVGAVALR